MHIDKRVRSLRVIVVGRHIDIAVVSLGEEDAFGPTAPDEAGLLCTARINPPHELGWHSVVFAPVQPAQQCGSAEGADTDVENKTDQRIKLILSEHYLNPLVYGTLRDIGVSPQQIQPPFASNSSLEFFWLVAITPTVVDEVSVANRAMTTGIVIEAAGGVMPLVIWSISRPSRDRSPPFSARCRMLSAHGGDPAKPLVDLCLPRC
jgi:hypothetical protein